MRPPRTGLGQPPTLVRALVAEAVGTFALVFAGAMNFFMYYKSSSMVLRMYGAKVVTESDAPDLYRMVDRLRQRAGLPMPTLAIAPHQQPIHGFHRFPRAFLTACPRQY